MTRIHTSKKKNFFNSPFFYIILCLLVFLLIRANFSIYKKRKIAQEKLADFSTQNSELKDNKGKLNQKNADLHTERGVEEFLRGDNFGKEGETLIRIVES